MSTSYLQDYGFSSEDSENFEKEIVEKEIAELRIALEGEGIALEGEVQLILNKVLMLGSATQTLIGRPVLPDTTVHAVVEEHALDAKVIIFKKKRRKNYRRTKGHRQELTKLRITDIQGIEKPEKTVPEKIKKTDSKKEEKVAVAA